MPMKTQLLIRSLTSKTLCSLATALLLNVWPAAQAQPNPDHPRPPQGERQRDNRPDPRLQPGPGALLMERVLTEDQRESMRAIMTSQREQMRGLQEKIRAARKELLKTSLADTFDEDTVRAKALAVAKLEAEVTVLRARAISQVQPSLSDEQIEQIMNPSLQDGPQPGDRRGNRPPRGPGDGNGPPRPPKPDPQ